MDETCPLCTRGGGLRVQAAGEHRRPGGGGLQQCGRRGRGEGARAERVKLYCLKSGAPPRARTPRARRLRASGGAGRPFAATLHRKLFERQRSGTAPRRVVLGRITCTHARPIMSSAAPCLTAGGLPPRLRRGGRGPRRAALRSCARRGRTAAGRAARSRGTAPRADGAIWLRAIQLHGWALAANKGA
jgi:hypothetical protein